LLKNLLGDTVKYGIGNVITKFFSVLVVPIIIAKNFSPDVFGEITIITTFVGLFTGLSFLGLDAAVGFYFFHGEENLRRNYLGTAFITRIIIAVFFFTIFYIFSKYIADAQFLLKDQSRYLLIILGAAIIPFDNCIAFFNDLSRFLIKPVLFNIINLLKTVIYFSFILIFLSNNLTIEKIFLSLIISSLLPSLFLFFYYKEHLRFKINFYCLKKMLKYGIPLVPVTIMHWTINSVSRFILNNYAGLEETGIYSMMITISGIFMLITFSISLAYPPYAMNIAKKENAQVIFSRIFLYLLILLVPLAFYFWSIIDIIILLFSKPVYLIGENIVILIVLQLILSLLYQCGGIGLTLKEKTIHFTIGYTISGFITILTSIFLCKYFGIFGAAVSVFLGNFIAVIYILLKSQKFYPIPYNKVFIISYTLILMIIVIFSLIMPNSNIFWNFIIRFFIGCVFMSIPFIFKIITINDIKIFLLPKKENN